MKRAVLIILLFAAVLVGGYIGERNMLARAFPAPPPTHQPGQPLQNGQR